MWTKVHWVRGIASTRVRVTKTRSASPTPTRRQEWSVEGSAGGEILMFLILCIVLATAWLLGWGAFHVAGGLIHLLLIVALISLVVHFVRGRGARA
jgi:hypothetical protein